MSLFSKSYLSPSKKRIRFIISCFVMMSLISSCLYSRKATVKLYNAYKDKSYDLIIVPGVPFDKGEWSKTMKGRIYWSKFLYDQGIAKNIMYSGSAVATPYYEGKIMAMYAAALGIPEEHIFYEIKAEHSTENIYYSYQKAKQLGFKKIGLASDRFQTRTLRRFTRKRVSPDIAMLPMVMDTMDVLFPTMIDPAIDAEKAFKENFVSLKKREGFFERLRGTFGKKIKGLN